MTETCFGSHRTTLRSDRVLVSETSHPPSLSTPAHSHPFLCLHFVLHGVYEESRRGETHRLGPGWFLFKPEGERHWNRFGDAGAVTLRVELDRGPDETLADALPGRTTSLRAPHLATLAGRAHAELARDDGLSGVVVESLALELFAGVARLAERKGAARSSALARRCADLLDDRFQVPYRLGLAAEELGVERTALARAFRREYGCSVGEYLRQRRVRYVAERLRQGSPRPLAELAADAGFADQSHLTRVFGEQTGVTPAVWRRLYGRSATGSPAAP